MFKVLTYYFIFKRHNCSLFDYYKNRPGSIQTYMGCLGSFLVKTVHGLFKELVRFSFTVKLN